MRRSPGELLLEQHLQELRHPFETEYRFHPVRRWRFDFAYPQHLLAIEVEGGVWMGGRHTRGRGFELDAEKYNSATIMGWKVLRFTTNMVTDGRAKAATAEALSVINLPPGT